QRLPGLKRDHVNFRLEPVSIDPDKASFLEEEPVAPGHDVLDVEMAVGVGGGGVVSALLLVFRDDLHHYFLELLAARFLHYCACNGGCLWRRRGLLRARQQHGAEKEDGEGEWAAVHEIANFL